MKPALVLAQSLLLLSLAACDRATSGQTPGVSSPPTMMPATAKSATRRAVKVIPWLEVNACKPEEIDRAVAGLKAWQAITNEAIISTIPGKSWLYKELSSRVPGMRIIPGIKTHPRLGKQSFDSLEGWKLLARDVAEVCQAAGETVVVLENETALKEYWNGECAVDQERLRSCLKLLPRKIKILWYPVVMGRSAAAKERGLAIVRVVEETCDVRFMDFGLSSPKSLRHKRTQTEKAALNGLAEQPSIPLVYFGASYWKHAEAPDVLSRVTGAEVIFYPGASDWVAAARSIPAAIQAARGESR